MRFFLIMLICYGVNSYGQTKNLNKSSTRIYKSEFSKPLQKDTAPFDPHKHCILITQKNYTIILNKKNFQIQSDQKLLSFLTRYRKEVIPHILSLIIDSTVSPEKMVAVLDIMQVVKIPNYQVISLDSISTPKILAVKQPTLVSVTSEIINDSSALLIAFRKSRIIVKLDNKTDTLNTPLELDAYISLNKRKILKEKILLQGNSNARHEEFKPILDVLKKHKYYSFKLITTPD